MSVDISNYLIATPAPVSLTNPVALELLGAEALVECAAFVTQLEDGSIRFEAPTKGASSKSVHRTRCEWSELEHWALSSAAHHWSRQELILTQVNSAKKVVIAQIHVKDANTPPLKVFWNKGNITAGFRSNFDTAELINFTLLTGVPLGASFKVSIHATAAGSVSISVLCQGRKSVCPPLKLDASWTGHEFEFHGGLYNQVDYTDFTDPEDGSICVLTELSTTHE
jgi:hypothetical protein